MADARELFSGHYDEINRRASASRTSGRLFFQETEPGEYDTFLIPSQRFVVFSFSHVSFSPISASKTQPAFRLFGAFSTEDDAIDHARLVSSVDPTCSVLTHDTHKWIVGAPSPEVYLDTVNRSETIERVLRQYDSALEHEKLEFEENVREQKCGNVREKEDLAQRAAPSCANSSKRAPATCLVADQRFAVVSIIPDFNADDANPQYLLRVYAFFVSLRECDQYIRNVAGKVVVQHNLDVISSGSWVFPQSMIESPRDVFRDDELNEIMQAQRKQPDEIKRYEDWAQANPNTDADFVKVLEQT